MPRRALRLTFPTALLAATILAFLLVAAPGCQKFKKMLPASTIDNPEKDSPEWVVQQVLKAGMDPDENRGWALYKSMIHPDAKPTVRSLHSWRTNNYNTLRRKWDLFVLNSDGDHCRGAAKKCDPATTKVVYEKQYDEEYNDGRGIKLFVVNPGNPELPTPCEMEKNNEGKWRVRRCSL